MKVVIRPKHRWLEILEHLRSFVYAMSGEDAGVLVEARKRLDMGLEPTPYQADRIEALREQFRYG